MSEGYGSGDADAETGNHQREALTFGVVHLFAGDRKAANLRCIL
ncbi:hypothetical protein BDD14_6500 [Edaphobacter modestus]|uniref:Uncharacterized protein n=1 Tax=Edaphobacter modestus TaxID=388466 RepID=A0A4Q7XZQ4_9BACT|nr:hypothetical protein BDD14_6500 [Edaphobacter modestus]